MDDRDSLPHVRRDRKRYVVIMPKSTVAYTVGFLKGNRAARIHRELLSGRRMARLNFRARGYSVSTVS